MKAFARVVGYALVGTLALACDAATAGWLQIGQTAIYEAYADPTTIRRVGSIVKIWTSLEFRVQQQLDGRRYYSIRSLSEFDCKEETVRLLSSSFYATRMGGGEIVSSFHGVRDWRPVLPESIDLELWKFVCARK